VGSACEDYRDDRGIRRFIDDAGERSMASRNGHGAHEPARRNRSRRAVLIVGAVVLLALAFGGGYLLAGGDDEATSPTPPPASPSPSTEPTASDQVTPTTSASPAPSPEPVLVDGRHFVYARSAKASPASMRFDLAEFLTDEAAQEAAEEHGDEAVNGYYIVNDNPRVRALPVAADVRVRYIPVSACCDLVPGTWEQFVEAVNATAQTDLDASAPWWITVRSEQVVRIEQQYLP
jgi:hypothetical protein